MLLGIGGDSAAISWRRPQNRGEAVAREIIPLPCSLSPCLTTSRTPAHMIPPLPFLRPPLTHHSLMRQLFQEIKGVSLPRPFPRIPYSEAMLKYGSDKPDLRFGMEIHDVSAVVRPH